MGSPTYGTAKSKFKKTKKYKSLCTMFTPNGIVEPGLILTGKEWEELLVYEVGNDFKSMFEITEK